MGAIGGHIGGRRRHEGLLLSARGAVYANFVLLFMPMRR
jgi:hypothetical protein